MIHAMRREVLLVRRLSPAQASRPVEVSPEQGQALWKRRAEVEIQRWLQACERPSKPARRSLALLVAAVIRRAPIPTAAAAANRRADRVRPD